MPDRTGPAEGAKGVVEEIKGRFKEAAGATPRVSNRENPRVQRSGPVSSTHALTGR